MNEDQKAKAAEENLKRVLDWHPRVDGRITWLLGINAAMLGALFSALGGLDEWTLLVITPAALAAGLLILSLGNLYIVIRPDTRAPAGSMLFFAEIAGETSERFIARWREMTVGSYLTDLNEQVHRNAEIVTKKFRCHRTALKMLTFAIVPWAITLLLINLNHHSKDESRKPTTTSSVIP